MFKFLTGLFKKKRNVSIPCRYYQGLCSIDNKASKFSNSGVYAYKYLSNNEIIHMAAIHRTFNSFSRFKMTDIYKEGDTYYVSVLDKEYPSNKIEVAYPEHRINLHKAKSIKPFDFDIASRIGAELKCNLLIHPTMKKIVVLEKVISSSSDHDDILYSKPTIYWNY